MSKQPSHIITFMENQGYVYDRETGSFKTPDQDIPDFLKGMLDKKGSSDAR